ncbi:hypothetical protein BGX34_004147 [Mortierella sp. NVP85]|nr:hypothetical protein BGX34_004147 [Mortierella sp. NVP85]
MNDAYSQAFRSRSSSEVVLVPTRRDPKSGQHAIHWKDIQQYLNEPQYVTHNGRMIMFLTDDNLKEYLIPLRIAYHPGEVLEVVLEDDSQGESSSTASSTGVPSYNIHVPDVPSVTPSPRQEIVDDDSLVPPISSKQVIDTADAASLPRGTGKAQYRPQFGRPENTRFEDSIERCFALATAMRPTTPEWAKEDVKLQKQLDRLQHQMRQMQQQMEEILGRIQQDDQQAQNLQQQMKAHVEETRQTLQQQLPLQAFDTFVHIQYRVQVVLTKSSSELSIPRLFIILPEPTAIVDGQGRPCSLQFRLYFLCECGANTMARDCSEPQEVHLADHPGYDIDKQDEFIQKYGSYLLTMMFMVKYGAVAGGLVVPPLLGLNCATEGGEDQERLQFIKKNIGRLVNDAKTYLESTVNAINDETNTMAQMDLGSSELAQLRSYLKFVDDDRPIGDLWAISTRKGHCAWVCCKHLLEYSEPDFQRLKYILFTAGGACHDNKVELKITSETTKKQLYNAIGEVRRIQKVGDWKSLKQVGLDHSLAMRSTSEMISRLNGLESLSLDFGQLSMVANDISHGVVGDVNLEVPRLCELTLDDFEFIHQCHPVLIKILHASENMDEARLVDILQHSTRLEELYIGCAGERFFILVNSILSTRDRILQSGGHVALRFLELKGEGLVPLKRLKPCGYHQHLLAVTISFSEEPHSFDMEAHVAFDEMYLSSDDSATCDFIRQYGWSIKTLGVPSSFSDRHAELLDQVTQERGSIIECANITPDSLTKTGLDALHRAIERSKNLRSVRLCLSMLPRDGWVMKALLLLERYKGQLMHICLNGDDVVEQWITHIEPVFPTKDEFPILETLYAANARNAPLGSVLQFFLHKTFNRKIQDALRRGYSNDV